MVYGSEGKYPDAAKALDEIIRKPDSAAAKAAAVFRALPSKIPADTLPALPRPWDFVYVYAGAPERALDALERQVAMGFIGGTILDEVWHPSFAAVRNTKKFNTLMRKAGMVDFWRAKGWPPQCHPTTADDFECS